MDEMRKENLESGNAHAMQEGHQVIAIPHLFAQRSLKQPKKIVGFETVTRFLADGTMLLPAEAKHHLDTPIHVQAVADASASFSNEYGHPVSFNIGRKAIRDPEALAIILATATRSRAVLRLEITEEIRPRDIAIMHRWFGRLSKLILVADDLPERHSMANVEMLHGLGFRIDEAKMHHPFVHMLDDKSASVREDARLRTHRLLETINGFGVERVVWEGVDAQDTRLHVAIEDLTREAPPMAHDVQGNAALTAENMALVLEGEQSLPPHPQHRNYRQNRGPRARA